MRLICKLVVAKIAVYDLGLRPKGADVDWITVPSVLVSGTDVNLLNREGPCRLIVAQRREACYVAGADGSFNLLPKLASRTAAPAPPRARRYAAPVAPSAVAPAASGTPRPRLDSALPNSHLRDASISDRGPQYVAGRPKVLLAPLSLKVDGVSSDLARPLSVSARQPRSTTRDPLNAKRRRYAATAVAQFAREIERHRPEACSRISRRYFDDPAERQPGRRSESAIRREETRGATHQ